MDRIKMEGTLEKIGLNKDEIQVYSTIVQYGFRTIGQIQTYYKQSADSIQSALSSLVNRGYIKEIKARNTEGTSYFIALPPQLKLTEDVSQRLENELKALSDDVKADWNKTMTNFRSQLNSFHNKITDNVDSHSQVVNNASNQFLESLSNIVETSQNDITEIVSKVNTETATLATTNQDNIAKAAQRVQDNVLNSFDTTIHKIGENHESFKTKIEETFGQLKQEHQERINDQLDALLLSIEGLKENISLHIQGFDEFTAKNKDIVNSSTAESIDTLTSASKNIVKESSKKLISTSDKIVQALDKKLDEFKVKVNEILASLNAELKKLEEATTSRIRTSIDKSKETAVNILKENETQFTELLSKIKVDSVEKLANLITQTELKTSEMKTKLGKDLTSYLKDFEKNSNELLSLLKKGIDNGFNLLKKNLSSSIENVSIQIKDFINEIMASFEETSNSYLEELSKTASDYQISLNDRLELFNTTNEEFKKNFISHLKQLREGVVTDIEENVNTNKESIHNLLSQREEQLKNEIEVFSDEFSKKGRDIRDEVPNLVQINYQDSLDRLNELNDQFNSTLTKLVEINSLFQDLDMKQMQRVFGKEEAPRISQLISSADRDLAVMKDNVGSKIEEMLTTFTTSMSSLSNDIFERINRKLDDYTQFKDRTLISIGQSLDGSRNELTNQFSKSIADMKSNIVDTYTTYETQFIELQDTTTKDLNEVVGSESKAFDDVMNSIKESLEELVNVAKSAEEGVDTEEESKMQMVIRDGLDGLQTTKDEILTQMKNNNKDVLGNLQDTLKTNIDEHSKLVKKVTSSMDETMKVLESEFTSAKNALDSDISVTLDKAGENYSTQTSKVNEEINTLIEQEVQQFIESTEGLMSELTVSPEKSSMLDDTVNSTKLELEKLAKDYPKWLEKDGGAFSSKLTQNLSEFQTKLQTDIDSMHGKVKEDLENVYTKTSDDLENNTTKIKEEFDKETKDYDLNITHQVNGLITNSDSNSSALVTNIQGTKDTLIDAISSGNDTIASDLSSIQKTVKDLFDSFLNSFREKLNQSLQASQSAEEQKDEYSSKLGSFKEEIIKGTQQEVENVDSNISNILNAIPSKIDVVLEATGESMRLLKSVLSLGKGIEPNPIEDIWIVSGLEQTKGTMMSLVNHTKSSVTLVTPKLDWLDSDFLDTFSRKMEIVTNTQAHTDEDSKILTKLLGMGNVTVKDAPGLTVMMGTRDGIEEGFFGHKAPSGEPILITTFNEEMVREITKIYYDYRSRAPLRG